MDDLITEEFLKQNLFERDKIGAGYFPWRYESKDYNVVVAPWTDGGEIFIYVENAKTRENIQFSKRKHCGNKLTKTDLHNCIKFMNVTDEFDYSIK